MRRARISMRSRAMCRSASAFSRCSRRSTTASRSARSRDIDIPLVARHFYHHAGWASLIDERISGHASRRRLRADHPVEFPAADARLEDRAGARGRQYGRAEAGRIHAADGARLRRDLRRGRPAARASSISSPATARPAPARRRMRTSTRSPSPARPRSAARSAPRPPAAARNCRWSSAASRPSSCSMTPISTARSKAWSTRSGSTRARSAAPARGSGAEGIAQQLLRQAARAHGDVARRRSARQVDRHRRDRRAGPASSASSVLCEAGARRGCSILAGRRRRCPTGAAFIPPTLVHRRRAGVASWRAKRSSARCLSP